MDCKYSPSWSPLKGTSRVLVWLLQLRVVMHVSIEAHKDAESVHLVLGATFNERFFKQRFFGFTRPLNLPPVLEARKMKILRQNLHVDLDRYLYCAHRFIHVLPIHSFVSIAYPLAWFALIKSKDSLRYRFQIHLKGQRLNSYTRPAINNKRFPIVSEKIDV